MQIDGLDIDLQNLPGLGATHGDRSGAHVAEKPLRTVGGMNGGQGRRYLEWRRRQNVRRARYRRHGHPFAAVDGEDGRQPGVEEAPMHRVGTGLNARDGCCFLHGNGPQFAAKTIRIK